MKQKRSSKSPRRVQKRIKNPDLMKADEIDILSERFARCLNDSNLEKKWVDIEHRVFKDLKSHGFEKRNWLLAVSGGMDSMAMLFLILRLASALKLKASVIHIHHGALKAKLSTSKDDLQLSRYREMASQFVSGVCRRMGIPFEVVKSQTFLKTELECREFRTAAIKTFMDRQPNHQPIRQAIHRSFNESFHHCLIAHHRDDYIETQFLRMIRGGGARSTSRPMKKFSEKSIRPFLEISKNEIVDYQKSFQFPFLEDPSNLKTDYLRNWLRNFWLPQLEERSPGALEAISRSLVLWSESHANEKSHNWPDELWVFKEDPGGRSGQDGRHLVWFNRFQYDCLNLQQRRDVIVRVFQKLKIKNFTLNHVLEVIKYLDKTDRVHSFRVASLMWTVDSKIVQFSP